MGRFIFSDVRGKKFGSILVEQFSETLVEVTLLDREGHAPAPIIRVHRDSFRHIVSPDSEDAAPASAGISPADLRNLRRDLALTEEHCQKVIRERNAALDDLALVKLERDKLQGERDQAVAELDDLRAKLTAASAMTEDTTREESPCDAQLERAWALGEAAQVVTKLAAVGMTPEEPSASLQTFAEWILGDAGLPRD